MVLLGNKILWLRSPMTLVLILMKLQGSNQETLTVSPVMLIDMELTQMAMADGSRIQWLKILVRIHAKSLILNASRLEEDILMV
jgi:hypothetical protein